MDRNIQNLLLSELHNVHAYIERLLHAQIDIYGDYQSAPIRELAGTWQRKISYQIEQNLLHSTWQGQHQDVENLLEFRHFLRQIEKIQSAFISLNMGSSPAIDFTIETINILYDFAYRLHVEINQNTQLEVQYPRLGLAEMNPDGLEANIISIQTKKMQPQAMPQNLSEKEEATPKRYGAQGLYAIQGELKEEFTPSEMNELSAEEEELLEERPVIAHFQLPLQAFYDFRDQAPGSLVTLDRQRQRKYDQMIHEGHEFVFHKDYQKALDAFNKALNYRDTAEVLTLIGWVHSLMGQVEKAKSYCLKAIKNDPDYGPPYNDLGSYFLAEGQVDESLKWFELAKKSIHYQNREYPYINSGRAYMTKKDLPRALDEFSKALTLAPYHEDLHKTVEKLKKSMLKMPRSLDPHDSSPPPLS